KLLMMSSTVFVHPEQPVAIGLAREIAQLIDHTLLLPQATASDVVRLCEEAIQYGFASVCVHPSNLALAVSLLQGTPVKPGTVVGFPSGANLTTTKRLEAEDAIRLGARELDMVLNVGALKSGE